MTIIQSNYEMNDLLVTSEVGLALIKHYESLHDGDLTKIGLQPKLCPAGVVTWGYGHTETYEGKPIKSFELARKLFPEMEDMTVEEAELLLKQDVVKEEEKVRKAIKRQLFQYEFDSLVSYFFNIGYSNNMIMLINANAPSDKIVEWFLDHYITANGKYLPGLFYRRQTEAHLYIKNELVFYNN